MINITYRNRPEKDRKAFIYEVSGQPGVWRIRLELYPESSVLSSNRSWWGGKILWGFDQYNYDAAMKIADKWIKNGEYPV